MRGAMSAFGRIQSPLRRGAGAAPVAQMGQARRIPTAAFALPFGMHRSFPLQSLNSNRVLKNYDMWRCSEFWPSARRANAPLPAAVSEREHNAAKNKKLCNPLGDSSFGRSPALARQSKPALGIFLPWPHSGPQAPPLSPRMVGMGFGQNSFSRHIS